MKSMLVTPTPSTLSVDRTASTSLLSWIDIRNIGLVLFGFVFVLVLVPPVRFYPLNDDWTYVRSVGELLQWSYEIPDWAQPTALTHITWGALFSVVFGYSFTTLTVANLVMSVSGLILFYLVLRHLSVTPGYALLGVCLLGFNPIYFNLSYSFMTDITFIAFLMAAMLSYLRATQDKGEVWFWLTGVTIALAYLTRQLGLLLLPPVLIYLWWSHRWTWRRAIAITAIPLAVLLAYTVWERMQPVQLVSFWLEAQRAEALRDIGDYIVGHTQGIVLMLIVPGLCMMPLLWRVRRPIFAMPLFAFFAFFLFRIAQDFGTVLPLSGNIVDHTGFIMGNYYTAHLWSEWVWAIAGILGLLSLSLYITACAESALKWLRKRPWKIREEEPALVAYMFGLGVAAVVLIVSTTLYDRYMLPVLVIFMVAALRRISLADAQGQRQKWRWVFVVPLALFSLLAERDYLEHTAVRWQAAEQVAAQGVPYHQIYAGYEWGGWYQYDEGVQKIMKEGDFSNIPFPPGAVVDPVFIVGDVKLPGYAEVRSFPYSSWLNGGQTQHVLVLKRRSRPGQ